MALDPVKTGMTYLAAVARVAAMDLALAGMSDQERYDATRRQHPFARELHDAKACRDKLERQKAAGRESAL